MDGPPPPNPPSLGRERSVDVVAQFMPTEAGNTFGEDMPMISLSGALFEFRGSGWFKLGTGEITLMRHKIEATQQRVVVVSKPGDTVLLNVEMPSQTTFSRIGGNLATLVWTSDTKEPREGNEDAQDAEEADDIVYALRMASPDEAAAFSRVIKMSASEYRAAAQLKSLDIREAAFKAQMAEQQRRSTEQAQELAAAEAKLKEVLRETEVLSK
jgi:hypothetical protein